jgi:DNA repair protein RecN (Recombination protein N)
LLRTLRINNFALIDELEISFSSGMTTITGETGTGKSILLGGLFLVLGKRAEIANIKNPLKKCYVEAVFNISDYNLINFFSLNNLDYDDETILRREISHNGKSRAFINDSPVNLKLLEKLSSKLIDIHSQHETQLLNSEKYQFLILDSFAKNESNINNYSDLLIEYKNISKQLKTLRSKQIESMNSLELNYFLYDELVKADLVKDITPLEQKYSELSNVELIKSNLSKAINFLENDQIGIINQFLEFRNLFKPISNLTNRYNSINERVNTLFYETEDVLEELKINIDKLEINPNELSVLEKKINELNNLLNKHNLKSVDDLIAKRDNLEKEINLSDNIKNSIDAIIKRKDELEIKLNSLAEIISRERSLSIPMLEKELINLTSDLGMIYSSFKIKLENKEEFLYNGKDSVTFLFKSNNSSDFRLLSKIASGGELSRIMLSLKNILSRFKKLPTIIFDEIDSGVSGKISDSVANLMYEMSQTMQVLTITHLPQVASKGDNQIKVFKKTTQSETNTFIKNLNKEERINEIALMLSGNKVSTTALAHAKQLLN